MFYEESRINRILNCELCNRKYDEPRSLPCGNTICNICICAIEDKLLLTNKSCFKCVLCADHHCVPQSGFPINKPIKKLMSEKPNEIYRGRDAEIFKANLNDVQMQISELETTILKGIDKIKEHCHQLRIQVQQAASEKFEEINRMTSSLMRQINNYEKECIQNAIVDEEYKQSFDQRITVISKFIDDNKGYLYQCNISEKEIITANEMFKMFKAKLDEEVVNINDFTFNYSLMEFIKPNKIQNMPENALGTLRFQRLGNYINSTQLKNVNLTECPSHKSDDSLVLSDICDLNKYYIAYFNTKNEVIVTAYDHVNNIKIEKNIISNCRSLFQMKILNNNLLALSYQKENSECCIVILDEQLNIILRNDDFCQMIIGENDSYLYCYSPMNKPNIRIYDKKLNRVELNQNFQGKKPTESFYFSDDVKRIAHRDNKYIWLDSTNLNILNDKSGELISSIPIVADHFELNSRDEIICLLKSEHKMKYFDIYGILIREIELVGFNLNSEFTFKIDKNDKIHFFDDLNVYF